MLFLLASWAMIVSATSATLLLFERDFTVSSVIFYDDNQDKQALSLDINNANISDWVNSTIFDNSDVTTFFSLLTMHNYSNVYLSLVFKENFIIDSISAVWSPSIKLNVLYLNYFDIITQSWIEYDTNDNTNSNNESNFVVNQGNSTNSGLDLELYSVDIDSLSTLITNEMRINISLARGNYDLGLASLMFNGRIS